MPYASATPSLFCASLFCAFKNHLDFQYNVSGSVESAAEETEKSVSPVLKLCGCLLVCCFYF